MLTQKTAIFIGVLVVIAIGAFIYGSYTKVHTSQSERTGTETLSAEEVVDLEVQAQAEYEAAGGTY